ncbi:hypothetical protein EIP91_002444 [Steccherinum ochraceum]|uniref:Uncharacterized protein n=1 Tax=Steccherinum ochraceum TaxID=92696 RepID=A0A4V2MWD7_9APHY|nr:hypothetical protein EIP91_002444 [Steccherinum ochraceum]
MSDPSLPAVLELLLDYLSDYLPPTAVDILETLITHLWNLTSSFATLVFTMASSPSTSWSAEKILPPIITLLAAYLALVSFYRTTGWMIRTAFAFVKWGFILSTLGAFAGYILANGAHEAAGNGLGAAGVLPMIGGYVLDWLNGAKPSDASKKPRTRSGTTRTKAQSKSKSRPNAWDSWDRHQDWQYTANSQDGRDPAAEVQKVLGDMLGSAQKVVAESGWWEVAKGAVNNFQTKAEEVKKDGGRSRREKNASRSR